MKIHILDNWTITKIRAGQVITSYKDIVKELVENSIDAKSTNINIYINFIKKEIQVIDDGEGIDKEDLKICLKSHSTSKFISIDYITHLGFRGEGLFAISECSNIEIISKKKNEDAFLFHSQYNNKEFLKKVAGNNGTKVVVKDIFEKTPEKKKFFSEKKDFLKIINLLEKLALSHNYINFNIYKNNKHYLNLNGKDFYQLVFQIFFSEINKKYEISSKNFKISLYLDTKKSDEKSHMLFFVNSRPVDDFGLSNLLKKIFYENFNNKNLKLVLCFLFIDYNFVDVNLLPDKSKIRISILEEIKEEIIKYFENLTKNFLKEEKNNQLMIESDYLINWFSYKNTYIIANYNYIIYFIDQHAISEKILFNKIKNSSYECQLLIEPISVYLNEEEKIKIQENNFIEELKFLKFNFDFIKNYLLIYGIPDFLSINSVEEVIKIFINEKNFHIFLHKLSNFSCKNSLKSGEKINEEEIKFFIKSINTNSNCNFCNHGRNTVLSWNEKELKKLFNRS